MPLPIYTYSLQAKQEEQNKTTQQIQDTVFHHPNVKIGGGLANLNVFDSQPWDEDLK